MSVKQPPPPCAPPLPPKGLSRDSNWRGAELDSNGCIALDRIISSFSAPITEEHAWAVIYESLKCLDNVITAQIRSYDAVDPSHLLVHSEGFVHPATFQKNSKRKGVDNDRRPLLSENKAISDLGLVVYGALDFGLNQFEQRALSAEMENMLELMSSADDGNSDDEGIEQDHDDFGEGHSSAESNRLPNSASDADSSAEPENERRKVSGLCKSLLMECARHLAAPGEAETHFRAVCRALVSESLELSTFMVKVSEFDAERAEELRELDLQDWARIWVQCVRDLRHGVKLKKVDYTKTPIEYEMTPYEILMDDIRSRRYKLNKVMVDGELPPKAKKDAHDIILDFIRSRPPLRPASRRKLPPARKYSTPQELLMMAIRSGGAKESLRKTPGPPEVKNPILVEASQSRCLLAVPETGFDSDSDSEDDEIRVTNKYNSQVLTGSSIVTTSVKPVQHDELDSTADFSNTTSIITSTPKTTSIKIISHKSPSRGLNRFNSFQYGRSQSYASGLTAFRSQKEADSSAAKKVIRPDPSFLSFDPHDDDHDEPDPDMLADHHNTAKPRKGVQWSSDALDLAVPSSPPSRQPSPRRSQEQENVVEIKPQQHPSILRNSRKASTSILNSVSPQHLSRSRVVQPEKPPRTSRPKSAVILTPTNTAAMAGINLNPDGSDSENHLTFRRRSSVSGSRHTSVIPISYDHRLATYNMSNPNLSLTSPNPNPASSMPYFKPDLSQTSSPSSPSFNSLKRSPSTFCAQSFLQYQQKSSNTQVSPVKRTPSYLRHSMSTVNLRRKQSPSPVSRARENRDVRFFSQAHSRQLSQPDLLADSPEPVSLMVSGLTRTARKLSTPAYLPSPVGGSQPFLQSRSLLAKSPSPLVASATRRFRSGMSGSSGRRQLPKVPETNIVKQDKFEQWASSLQSLDLTLEEVVHIRSVLTKAELEGLTIDSNLKEDLERGKVCFLCMKTKFGIFSWSYQCQLCQHSVCSSCLGKMRIPSEHFSNIPVFALGVTNEKENEAKEESGIFSFTSSARRKSSLFGSGDKSTDENGGKVQNERRSSAEESRSNMRGLQTDKKDPKVKLRRSNTVSHKEKPEVKAGSQVNVCLDCKDMILQIIRTQRATRRQQFTKSLCFT